MQKVKITKPSKGYQSARTAEYRISPITTIKAGSYYLIEVSHGMYAISKKKKSKAKAYEIFWVNPGKKGGSIYKYTAKDKESTKSKSDSKNSNTSSSSSDSSSGDDSGGSSDSSEGSIKVSASSIFGTALNIKNKVATTPVYTKNSHYMQNVASVAFDSYIKNMITNSVLKFKTPVDISDSVSASFEDVSIRGRSSTIRGYDSSGPRTVSFSLSLSADYTEEELRTTIAKFKALEYPAYSGYVESPYCYLKLGKAVKGLFTCDSVEVSYSDAPIRDEFFTKADISLSFTELLEIPYSAAEIERFGGMSS